MNHSESIAKLADALARAHAEFEPVKKEVKNTFFKNKYADLSALIDATGKGLSKNGLAVIQSPGKLTEANRVLLTTILIHSSGEWLSDELDMPVSKPDAQGVGSALTYARRYAYGAILNIAGENDDDGNAASGLEVDKKSEKQFKKEYEAKTDDQTGITEGQVIAFNKTAKLGGRTSGQIFLFLKSIGRTKVEEMTKLQFNDAIKWAANREEMEKTIQRHIEMPKPLNVDKHNFAKLFAMAKAKNIPQADVKKVGHEIYQVESLNDLTGEQFSGLLEWVEGQTA